MGYRSEKNKKFILNRALLEVKVEELGKVVKFYETFGESRLEEQKRFELLRGTCLNGW